MIWPVRGVSTYDLMDTITADMVKVNLLAIGAVFLILLLMKRQLLLPVILVLSIETAIWINLAIPYFRGHVRVLHCLPHHQLGAAGRYGGLRHPLFRPLSGVPRDAGPQRSRCGHGVRCDHLGQHHRQRHGGGGL